MKQQIDGCNGQNISDSTFLPQISRIWGAMVVTALSTTGCAAILWESDSSFRTHKTESHSPATERKTTPADPPTDPVDNSDVLLERDPATGDIIVPTVSQTGALGRPSLPPLNDDAFTVTPPSRDRLDKQSKHDIVPAAQAPLLPAQTSEPAPLQQRGEFEGETHSIIEEPQGQTYFSETQQTQTNPAGANDKVWASERHNDEGDGRWASHLASYKSLGDARAGWRQLQADLPTTPTVGPVVSKVELPAKGVFYRLKIGPFNSRAEASAACLPLNQRGQYCIIMPFAGSSL